MFLVFITKYVSIQTKQGILYVYERLALASIHIKFIYIFMLKR